ncbi:cell division protein FtsZ [Salirhabdus sp. Marseille-P4669]|uniref:cell division protein FtsZ n=1 Tax=Salirhabdus sp. Marseille-P4669 TaxID=2042310 RepID=UPI000C7C09CA|nr:cell division protein FtsZ [Salirhabdus sp. Marseille-P4669]
MGKNVQIWNIKHADYENQCHLVNEMERDDICFYRFIGGNSSETEDFIHHLDELKEKKCLLLGIFRFPFRFEGKKRMQTAIHQYYWMKEICDSVIFFHGDGMLESIDTTTSFVNANEIFESYENKAVKSLEDMLCETGVMNIDAQDVKTFIKGIKGPLFLHTIDGDSFDEPLKYLISAPYLPDNYTDGKQMIMNIGYTKEVHMEAFKNINLRLNDMFHKADLVKLGTYLMNEPGNRFRITMLVNGIDDPFPQPENFKSTHSSPFWIKRKWELMLKKGKNIKLFSSSKNA